MAYQASVVGLTAFSLATTVGIISQSKIIPQLLLSYFGLNEKFQATFIHILGLLMVIGGSLAYALMRWRVVQQETEQDKQMKAGSNFITTEQRD